MPDEQKFCNQCGSLKHEGDCVWMHEAKEGIPEVGMFEPKVKFKKCGPVLVSEDKRHA